MRRSTYWADRRSSAPHLDLLVYSGSYPKSEIEVERFQMQQIAVGVGGLNPRFI